MDQWEKVRYDVEGKCDKAQAAYDCRDYDMKPAHKYNETDDEDAQRYMQKHR